MEFHGEQLLAYCEALIKDNGRFRIACPLRTEDGFPCIPVSTVRSHRNGDRLIDYLESVQEEPIAELSNSGKQERQKPIFAQY
jgi:hypothetical protein